MKEKILCTIIILCLGLFAYLGYIGRGSPSKPGGEQKVKTGYLTKRVVF